jgi:cell wall assembly regulator SMI1
MTDIQRVWREYRSELASKAPLAFANLAGPAAPQAIAAVEATLGQALPGELRDLLILNDGQVKPMECCALPGLIFLSCSQIAKEWTMWAKLRDSEGPDNLESLNDSCRALEPGVLDVYTHPGWIPLLKDGERADYLGLDLAPTVQGSSGQVINFGRDEERHFIPFKTLTECLAYWLEEVRAGRCRELPATPTQPAWFQHAGGNSLEVLRERSGY